MNFSSGVIWKGLTGFAGLGKIKKEANQANGMRLIRVRVGFWKKLRWATGSWANPRTKKAKGGSLAKLAKAALPKKIGSPVFLSCGNRSLTELTELNEF
jgi:hypothetical protein